MILQTSAGNKFTFEVVEEGIKIVFYNEDSCTSEETIVSYSEWDALNELLSVLKNRFVEPKVW